VPHPTDLPHAVDEQERAAIALVDKAIEDLRAAVKSLVKVRHKESNDE
jgi:signal transduction histidine kinase